MNKKKPKPKPKIEKAYENLKFLHGPWGRTIRIISEYQHPLSVFVTQKVTGLAVFFGSARIPSPESVSSKKHNKNLDLLSPFYEDARKFAKLLTQWFMEVPKRRFLVCSGGGEGIMEAANRGAYDAGGESVGLNISLPFEQTVNPYVTDKYNIEFHYFFLRKYWFISLAKALVVFPGGFGTLDELMETLTLIQTQKIKKKLPVVIFGKKFWEKIINFEALVEFGVISKEDLSLFRFYDDVDEAFEYIKKSIIQNDPMLRKSKG